jgi:hypothetical protein
LKIAAPFSIRRIPPRGTIIATLQVITAFLRMGTKAGLLLKETSGIGNDEKRRSGVGADREP